MSRFSTAVVVIAVTLAAAGGGARAQLAAGPCAAPTTAGSAAVSVLSDGRQRTAIVHVPAAAAGRRLPVLIALHGAGQNGTFFESYTGYSAIADAQHFIAVYPNALATPRFDGRPFWNIDDSDPSQPDDVRFIADLLTQLEATRCVDARAVFATGVSNGGGMAARLGCQLSDRIAAIAPVAGGYKSLPPCHPSHPVSVLEVHGTSDPTVPYGGAPGSHAGAVMPYVRSWVTSDGCAAKPRQTTPAPRVVRLDYHACLDGTAVAHLRLVGGGHQLEGALPPDPGQAASIDVPWEVWRFVRDHPQRPAPAAVARRGSDTRSL